MGFLADICDRVRRDLDRAPLDDSALFARARSMPPARDFLEALRSRRPAIVAEVKRASPSAGEIANVDPVDQARSYEAGGAAAISVLTEPQHFDGTMSDLVAVRSAVSLPVLRKDFLLHPSQIIESRAYGADAVLLIVACLPSSELTALIGAAGDLGLEALVETHNEREVEVAVEAGARVIGVNARDLETLEVDLDAAIARLAAVPSDRLAVLESGVSTRSQVEAALDAGASAILVGEALMRSSDPRAALQELAKETT